MSAEWYVARPGQQQVGPVTAQQLKQMAGSGQVSGSDLVWKQGMSGWVPASQVKGLLGDAVTSKAPEPMAAPAPAAPEPYAAPAPQPYDEPPRRRSSSNGGEVWYYDFIEKYAFLFMWIGIALAGFYLLDDIITNLVAMFKSDSVEASFGGGHASASFGQPWWRLLLNILKALIFYPACAAGSVVFAATVRLLAEMGRTLRSIEKKSSGSS